MISSHSLGFTWFRLYLLFSILPLSFHDFSWSTIAYLRYLNVTDKDGWLEIDPEKLRFKTSCLTWATTAVTLVISIPLGYQLLENELTSDSEIYIILEAGLLLVLTLLPYLAAFWFYYRIFKFARRVKAVETNMIDDSVPSTRQSPIVQRQIMSTNDGAARETMEAVKITRTDGSVRETIEAVNVIVDDSSDDDLIEIGESQCEKQVSNLVSHILKNHIKKSCMILIVDSLNHKDIQSHITYVSKYLQETCAYLAVRSLLTLCVIKVVSFICFANFATTKSSSEACTSLIILCIAASVLRHPVILLISIWNFGPLRNTVGLYIENLPHHMSSFFASPLHRWKESLKLKFSHREDQRRIVIPGYDDDVSDSSCSDDETKSRRRGKCFNY